VNLASEFGAASNLTAPFPFFKSIEYDETTFPPFTLRILNSKVAPTFFTMSLPYSAYAK